jgi:hypothetical protein
MHSRFTGDSPVNRMMIMELDKKEAVLQAVADEYERKILSSTVLRGKSIEQISAECGIPISSCYRKVHELLSLKLLRIEKITILESGKKFESFRSVIKDAVLSLSPSGELTVEVTILSRELDERLGEMWKSMRSGNELPPITA